MGAGFGCWIGQAEIDRNPENLVSRGRKGVGTSVDKANYSPLEFTAGYSLTGIGTALFCKHRGRRATVVERRAYILSLSGSFEDMID